VVSLTGARGLASSVRDYLFFKSCGIPRVIGIPVRKRDLVCQQIPGTGRFEPEYRRLLRRVSALGPVDGSDARWRGLELQGAEIAHARRLIADGGIVGPFMAASLGTKVPAKDWGLENWRGLLAEVTSAWPEMALVLLGSGDEFGRSAELMAGWLGPKINLCGKTAPRISGAILADAALFVGHDSGPMHLAAAAGTQCVAIFALRNPPGQWFPLGEGHSIFYPRLPFDRSRTDDVEYQQRAISTISVSEVADAVTSRIAVLGIQSESTLAPTL
jgi:ADP-heptose:LPS heptosyltransferase